LDRLAVIHALPRAWAKVGKCSAARIAITAITASNSIRLNAARRALEDARGYSLWPAERRAIDEDVSAVRAQLDEAEFATAWAAGQAMPPDEAIALALQEVAAV
jgi:hypothetical protein